MNSSIHANEADVCDINGHSLGANLEQSHVGYRVPDQICYRTVRQLVRSKQSISSHERHINHNSPLPPSPDPEPPPNPNAAFNIPNAGPSASIVSRCRADLDCYISGFGP